MPDRQLTLLVLGCPPHDGFLPFLHDRLGERHHLLAANSDSFFVEHGELRHTSYDLERIDCAIIRDVGPPGDQLLWRWLARQMPFLNQPQAMAAAANKADQYERLVAAGVPLPDYLLLFHPEQAVLVAERFAPPYVLKDPRIESGCGVLLTSSPAALEDQLAYLWSIDRSRFPLIVQQLVEERDGHATDYRLVLLGEELVIATRRESEHFKTNLYQGGSIARFEPPPRFLEVARAALAAVGLRFGGVDLIEDGPGRPLVLEVNGSPGGLDVYHQRYGVDAAGALAGFLTEVTMAGTSPREMDEMRQLPGKLPQPKEPATE